MRMASVDSGTSKASAAHSSPTARAAVAVIAAASRGRRGGVGVQADASAMFRAVAAAERASVKEETDEGGSSVFSRLAGGKLQNKRDSPEQRELRKKQAAVKAATNFRGEVRQVPRPLLYSRVTAV